MTDTPTPGQVAYEAWFLGMENTMPAGSQRWQAHDARVQAAWEAAAQAVLDAGPEHQERAHGA